MSQSSGSHRGMGIGAREVIVLAALCILQTGCALWPWKSASTGQPTPSVTIAGERFGAADDALGPLGGGRGYTRLVTNPTYRVKTEEELMEALKKAKSGELVYVDDAAELDFSPWIMAEELVLIVPEGVTLASGRGRDGSPGALLQSAAFKTQPFIETGGANVRITGLRIQGPDPKVRDVPLDRWAKQGDKSGDGRKTYYAFPTSDGIRARHPKLEVDNCELWGWSHGAVDLKPGATDARVHHNFIRHNQRAHLGYGVVLDRATVLIESNIFDANRHSIASTGRPGSGYEAANNLVLEHATSHVFDMHGGRDRNDGTQIAGDWMKFHHNTVRAAHVPALVIRGIPQEKVEVHHNWFLAADPSTIRALVQPRDYLSVTRNLFGPEAKLVE